MDNATDRLIYSFSYRKSEEIRFNLREYKRKQYLDLRLWFVEKKTGEFLPSKKGISLPVDSVHNLALGMSRVLGAVPAAGAGTEAPQADARATSLTDDLDGAA